MEKDTETKLFKEINAIKDGMNEIKVCIAQLPCKVHDERFNSVDKSLKRVWGVVLVILTVMTGLGLSAAIALSNSQ